MGKQTIHELLRSETEKEYFAPILKEQHAQALEFLRKLEIAERAFSSTSGYYNRKESALAPDLEWMVGESVLRVKALLVTKVWEDGGFEKGWERLGWYGLREADPMARIVAEAFDKLSYNVDEDLVEKFLPYFAVNVATLPFKWSYAKPPDADRGFLRVLIFGGRKKLIMPDTNLAKTIGTHLRFYKNKFPRPHGTGENSIAL